MRDTSLLDAIFMVAFTVRGSFWATNIYRLTLVRGSAPRARAAGAQVVLGVGPLSADIAFVLLAISEPVHYPLWAVVLPLLVLFVSRADWRAWREAWDESSCPGRMKRLRERLQALAPTPAAAGAA